MASDTVTRSGRGKRRAAAQPVRRSPSPPVADPAMQAGERSDIGLYDAWNDDVAELRSRVAVLSEELAKAEAAAANSEAAARFLAAGLRELLPSPALDDETAQADVAKQLIYLWQYTVADREPVRRAVGSRLAKSEGLSAMTRRRARLNGEGHGFRLGFYPQQTPEELERLRSEVAAAGLFDAAWYRQQHPEAGAADPLEYFIQVGLPEDHDPHPLFDTGWYRGQAGGEASRDFPLIHFLRHGARDETSPHPLFDPGWYAGQGPKLAESENPLAHFVARGAEEGRSPHPAFDVGWYRRSRGEALADRNPLVDYVCHADAWRCSPHPLLDVDWYLSRNPRARRRLANPLIDYLEFGVVEDSNPHPLFDTLWYLAANPDAVAGGLHPFVHFLRSDPVECRQTSPWFDAMWYRASHDDVAASGLHALTHFVTRGRSEGRQPSRSLPFRKLRGLVQQTTGTPLPPLLAYLAGADTAAPSDDGERGRAPAARLAAEVLRFDEPEPAFRDYWLPDRLREYIIHRFGNDAVPFVRAMMAIISRHERDPRAFDKSYDCRRLVAELREAAVDAHPEAAVDVSIVVPVFNSLVYTLTCLRSLFEMETRYRFEVLIGDDASTDATGSVISAIGGRVRHIRHQENLGFLLNCNLAALQARGRHIVFLNNDVIVLPRWLDELAGLLDSDPKIGIAGSKLLNADGTLQEAGGIYWNDGTAWNFGRGEDARLPEFNYVKEVDYCSGASIALPLTVWRAFKGFDPAYVPAYCEDADLAFQIRAAGLKTVYQPFSEVVHHEGKSHGTDTSAGIKAYQLTNMEKLYRRWWETLTSEHFGAGKQVFLARDRSRLRPHILFIDHYIPQWDQDCGSRLMLLYLRMFIDGGFQVTFWPDNLYEDPNYIRTLQKVGIEVVYSSHGMHRSFESWIKNRAGYYNYIFISRPHIAIQYLSAIRENGIGKIMYYGHDLHWRRLALEHELTGDAAMLPEIEHWRDLEGRVCEGSDVIFYPSREECEVIREQFPGKQVIELPVAYFGEEFVRQSSAIEGAERERDPFHLLFVGGFGHTPNIDAMTWFAAEIFPRLRKRDRRFRLTIVGSNPPAEIEGLKSDSIDVTGYISDAALGEFYRVAGIAIAPLRFGAGVKGKVIEAFAFGIPVVTTTVGMQGIDDPHATGFVADDAKGLAQAIYRAATDRRAAGSKVAAGFEFLKRKYSRDYVRSLLAQAVAELRRPSGGVTSGETLAAK
jgi:GT2 family glycosyltransferase